MNLPPDQTLLELQDVSLAFGGLQAVEQVSLRVPPGAVKAVIGPNGAGKTTLFHLVSGFLAPSRAASSFREKKSRACRPTSSPGGVSPAPSNWCNSSTT